MKKLDIYRAVNGVGEDLLQECLETRAKKKRKRYVGPLAACLALCIIAASTDLFGLAKKGNTFNDTAADISQEEPDGCTPSDSKNDATQEEPPELLESTYDLVSEDLTVWYQEEGTWKNKHYENWQQTKLFTTTLTVEDLTVPKEAPPEAVCYVDFHNGTVISFAGEGEKGSIWRTAGEFSPGQELTAVEACVLFPEGSLEAFSELQEGQPQASSEPERVTIIDEIK